jgi:hypothetical protein
MVYYVWLWRGCTLVRCPSVGSRATNMNPIHFPSVDLRDGSTQALPTQPYFASFTLWESDTLGYAVCCADDTDFLLEFVTQDCLSLVTHENIFRDSNETWLCSSCEPLPLVTGDFNDSFVCPPQWHGLSLLAQTLGSWIRIPLKAWMSVCFYSVFVLSCV